jgi:hypothetical protein
MCAMMLQTWEKYWMKNRNISPGWLLHNMEVDLDTRLRLRTLIVCHELTAEFSLWVYVLTRKVHEPRLGKKPGRVRDELSKNPPITKPRVQAKSVPTNLGGCKTRLTQTHRGSTIQQVPIVFDLGRQKKYIIEIYWGSKHWITGSKENKHSWLIHVSKIK